MTTLYTCDGNVTVNPEGALLCDNWVSFPLSEIESAIFGQLDKLLGWDTDTYLLVISTQLAFFITGIGAGMCARYLSRR